MPYKDKEKEREYKKIYNKKYKQSPEVKARAREHIKKVRQNPEVRAKEKEYYQKPEVKERRKTPENKLKAKKYNKKYYQRQEIKERVNEYRINKCKTNKNFNVRNRLRCLFSNALRIYTKTGKIMTSKKYGINYKAIIIYLKPFPQDLSKYHIDHIKPLCSFTFIKEDGSTNLEEVEKAFAPENHQWLTVQENLSKGGKYK